MRDTNFLDYETSQYDCFDLYASYTVQDRSLGGIVLSVGIENLTDEDPPIFPSWSNANTPRSTTSSLGASSSASAIPHSEAAHHWRATGPQPADCLVFPAITAFGPHVIDQGAPYRRHYGFN